MLTLARLLFCSLILDGAVVHRLLAACAAAGLALLMVVVPGNDYLARAVTSPPLIPVVGSGVADPLSVLSSVIRDAKIRDAAGAVNASRTRGMQASAIRKLTAQRAWRVARAAVTAGTPTAAEAELVVAAKASFRMPAFSAGGLARGVGAAGLLYTALDVGGWLGHGTLSAVGVNSDGIMCSSETGPVLEFFAHADCGAWDAAPGFVPNEGLVIKPAGWTENWYVHAWEYFGPGGNYFSCTLAGAVAAASGTIICTIVEGTRDVGGIFLRGLWCKGASGSPVPGVWSHALMQFGDSSEYLANSLTSGVSQWSCPAGTVLYSILYDPQGSPDSMASCEPPGRARPCQPEWYSEASPNYTAATNPNPDRFLRCEIAFSDGSTLYADTVAFKETTRIIPAPVCPSFPPELTVTSTTIWLITTGGDPVQLSTQETTPGYAASAAAYPECVDGTCVLDLRSVGTGLSCFAGLWRPCSPRPTPSGKGSSSTTASPIEPPRSAS